MNTTVANLWGQGKVKTVRFDEKHLTSSSGAKPFVTYLRKVGLPAFCDGPLGLDKRVRLYTISQLVLLMVTAIVVVVGDPSLDKAGQRVYQELEKISFEGMHYRKDIGQGGEGGPSALLRWPWQWGS
ncbi:hypothetical protein MYX64_08185 [Nitrospinae bacterium AH_259_B05_G02_I21]|nr:hypothetical protein [Nitrospinae bacterium AH_259_B05_G02_I21]